MMTRMERATAIWAVALPRRRTEGSSECSFSPPVRPLASALRDRLLQSVASGLEAGAHTPAVLLPRPAKIGEVGDHADQVDLRLAARLDAFCSAAWARKSSA
jgi:hypothetical protein